MLQLIEELEVSKMGEVAGQLISTIVGKKSGQLRGLTVEDLVTGSVRRINFNDIDNMGAYLEEMGYRPKAGGSHINGIHYTDEEIDRDVELYDAFAMGRRRHSGEMAATAEEIAGFRQGYARDPELLANFEAGLRGDASPPFLMIQ